MVGIHNKLKKWKSITFILIVSLLLTITESIFNDSIVNLVVIFLSILVGTLILYRENVKMNKYFIIFYLMLIIVIYLMEGQVDYLNIVAIAFSVFCIGHLFFVQFYEIINLKKEVPFKEMIILVSITVYLINLKLGFTESDILLVLGMFLFSMPYITIYYVVNDDKTRDKKTPSNKTISIGFFFITTLLLLNYIYNVSIAIYLVILNSMFFQIYATNYLSLERKVEK